MSEFKNLEELKKLLQLCRKNGVNHVKLGEIEVSFSPEAQMLESPYLQKKRAEADSKIDIKEGFNEDVLIDWSAGGVM